MSMSEGFHHKEKLITKELLDYIEQLGNNGNLKELDILNEKYLNYFHNGIEDSNSSLLDLSEYIDITSEPLRAEQKLTEHYPASFFKNRILDSLPE